MHNESQAVREPEPAKPSKWSRMKDRAITATWVTAIFVAPTVVTGAAVYASTRNAKMALETAKLNLEAAKLNKS